MKMTKHNPWLTIGVILVLGAFLLGAGAMPHPAEAISLGGTIGDLVKIFGIAWVVDRFADDIDRTINSLLRQHEAEIQGHTKVVPIIRVGSGTAVGAAQIMGPQSQVEKVQAVAEVELRITGSVRARGLIPVTTRKGLSGTPGGVGGVGVSANIKFPL